MGKLLMVLSVGLVGLVAFAKWGHHDRMKCIAWYEDGCLKSVISSGPNPG